MRRYLRLLTWLFLLPAAGPAGAASFDCAKATTAVEETICEDPALSKADERLAEAYASALAVTLAPGALQTEQSQWLGQRNKLVGAGPLQLAYKSRIAELTETTGNWRRVPRQIAAESAAKTCVLPPDPPDGSCRLESFGAINEALRYQIQAYRDGDLWTAGGVAIFRVASGHLVPLALTAVDTAHFDAPRLAQSGHLLVVPGHLEGTGNFNAELVYRLGSDGQLQEVDTEGWLTELPRHLPKGLGAWKGIYPDYDTLTAETPLWKEGDGNCCPTGGRAFIRLDLKNRRLAIVDVRTKLGEAAAQGEP
jgi:uncharacterized protein